MVQSHASCHWTSPDQRERAGLPSERRAPLASGAPGSRTPRVSLDDAFTARPGFPTGLEPRTLPKARKPPSRPGGSFALLRRDRQSYASGALPPGTMPPCCTDGWAYDQAASRPQSRWKLANRAAWAWRVNASLLPRRIMAWFLEDERTDPRRLSIHYATTTNKSTGNRRQSGLAR